MTLMTLSRAAATTLALTLVFGTLPSGPARSDGTTNAVFSVSIRGLSAGTLTVKGQETGGRYSTSGVLQSGGLVGLISKLKYVAKSQGQITSTGFRPTRYEENANTGKRKSSAVMAYKRGVPQVKSYSPPRQPGPDAINPSTQGGTVDPMSAIYAALRDVNADQVCKLKVAMFDGKRRSQVKLHNPRTEGKTITCRGEYRRLKGFSKEDMAEKSRFPFTLHYTAIGENRYQVQKVVTQTLYGTAVMLRQ